MPAAGSLSAHSLLAAGRHYTPTKCQPPCPKGTPSDPGPNLPTVSQLKNQKVQDGELNQMFRIGNSNSLKLPEKAPF